MRRRAVCIVTSGHVGSAPRVWKEADALHAAGYDVRVVYREATPGVRPLDADVLERSNWSHDVVRLPRRTTRWRAGFVRRMADVAGRFSSSDVVDRNRVAPDWGSLARAAARQAAALYIGHNLGGLIAAAAAASVHGARVGFDAEDDHVGELPSTASVLRALRTRVQSRRIAHCSLRTASSPLIARSLEERFGVRFVPILNAFDSIDPAESARANGTVYWASQTIGPGRGLEALVALLGAAIPDARLHLRGWCVPGYERELRRCAGAAGLPSAQLSILPTALPSRMTELARDYELVACCEVRKHENPQHCLSNKIFEALAAGVPVLLSATAAHRELAPQLGDAALLLDVEQPSADTIATLRAWWTNPDARARSRHAAHRVGSGSLGLRAQARGIVSAVEAALAD